MKGGSRPKSGLVEIECRYCKELFTPVRTKQFVCFKPICKKANNKKNATAYQKANKRSYSETMAKWRRENPAKRILSNIKSRGNIDLDIEWIQVRLDKGICEVTGIPFEFPDYGTAKPGFNHHPWTASIDRVDPNKGYCKTNCKMVVWAYNRAKGLWTDEVVQKLARGVLNELD